MSRILSLCVLVPMLGSLLDADWKIVTRMADSQMTRYYKGSLTRTDSLPAYTEVVDWDHRSQINWRSDLRQYVVVEWPSLPHDDALPGPVINIERNTTETGERKRFFGRTARHLVTRVTRDDGQNSVIDGWYVDTPGLAMYGRGGTTAVAYLVAAVGQRQGPPQIPFKQTGPAPEGLAVWQKTTSSTTLPGGPARTYETVSEVTDLVERTLPDKLFQPPDGYQRVGSLPASFSNRPVRHTWGELLEARWQSFEDWLSGLF